MSAERQRHADAFGAAAAAYERGRPGYPDAAVDWLLPPAARSVLDLGAGTGKLTRQLVERGLDTRAVEPAAEMLAQLRAAVPAAAALLGSAEAIPLPAGSVDAVLVAQAWHWVDPVRAGAEVARVLGPGGRLGLVWNLRDDQVPWVADLSALIKGVDRVGMTTGAQLDPDLFGPLERAEFDWSQRLSKAAVLDLVASRSYVIIQPAADRAALLDQVRDFLDHRPELATDDEVELPYVTVALRAERR